MFKKLLPLILFFGILTVAVIIQRMTVQRPHDMVTESGMTRLLPEDFLVADVTRLEIYQGSKPEEKTVLTQSKEGWRLESAFRAPGDKDKIENFLGKLKNLEGTERPASKDYFGEFQLEEKQALHLSIARKETATVLLVGKNIENSGCFIRHSTGEKVYEVGKNLRQDVGIWSDTSSLKSNHWLDKNILKLEKDKIARIVMEYPQRKLVFVREEKKVEKKDGDDKKAAEAKKEYEWKLAEGGFGAKHKQSGVDGLLTSMQNIEATDVVDPKEKQKWGLQIPQYRLEVTMEDNSKHVITAGVPEPTKDVYYILEARPELVYQVSSWRFGELFKKGNAFFDLPSLTLDKTNIREIEINRPEGTVVLAREVKKDKDNEEVLWSVVSPALNLKIHKETADNIVGKLASLRCEEYSDTSDAQATGLAQPGYQLVVKMKDDSKHTILAGKDIAILEGRYCSIDEQKTVAILGKTGQQELFPTYSKLFTLEPIYLAIQEFTLTRDNVSFTLKKAQDKWELVSDNSSAAADTAAVEKLAKAFQPLKAADITFRSQDIVTRKTLATVLLRGEQGPQSVTMYEKRAEEARYPATIGEQKEVYWLEAEATGLILQAADSYKAKEEVKKEAAIQTPQTPIIVAPPEQPKDTQAPAKTEPAQTTPSQPTVAPPEEAKTVAPPEKDK